SVTIGATPYTCSNITYSGLTPLSGITRPVISCGSGQTEADFPPEVSGNLALIKRGTNTFADKTTRAKAAGAVGVIIYNNVVDNITWTMLSAAPDWLPGVQITLADGEAILASLPATGTLVNYADPANAYSVQNGTSMACPHVSGAVAFAAWNFPNETMTQRINRISNNTTAVASLAGKIRTGGRLDLLKIIDTDIDGLPDWWETEQFGNLARTGAEDTDGDGFTNLTEFLASSIPTSGSSRLAFSDFLPVIGSGNNQVTLTFPTVAYRRYQVEWSENLQPPWTQLGATVTGSGSPFQIIDTNSSSKRFYRLILLDD
ncbi:MAG TPA: PA domain-containing protein, partial [Luteolibacter sp.]|nr:PA domain-containing protein [Luteolibacter sp.]